MSNIVLVSREPLHGRTISVLGSYSNWKEAYKACKSLIGNSSYTGGIFLYKDIDELEDLMMSWPIDWKEHKLYYNDFLEVYMQRT